jgi:alginate O-acetyltransferase complex protein AlgI
VLFNSFEYVFFFLVVFFLYWSLIRFSRVAFTVLLLASLLFYSCWKPYYLLLIIASSCVDYFCGKRISNADDPKVRKRYLLFSVFYNLGILSIFKYFNFFMENFDDLVTHFGWFDHFMLGDLYLPGGRLTLFLPVGISFFTFQSMSYTIDIYRKTLTPAKHYFQYLLYLSFFPQLVAGPIVRASDFLPQLLNAPKMTSEMGGRGMYLIALGLFKKIAIADYLALNLVDRVFTTPDAYSSVETLLGVYGYAFQIYCDFSGYSDIAIGCALLLGFEFPENFRTPYQSTDLQEFWRRWHISLSGWLRDYLYISMGGNRLGVVRTYFNLMMTMVLGGLWHGAGWNFLIWGLLHGCALAILRMWQEWIKSMNQASFLPRMYRSLIWQGIGWIATFHYVCFAWIFFRAPTFDEAMLVIKRFFEGSLYVVNVNQNLSIALSTAFILHFFPRKIFLKSVETFSKMPAFIQAFMLFLFAILLKQVAVSDLVPFIYFQF